MNDARIELELISRYQNTIENKVCEIEMNEQLKLKLAKAGIKHNGPIVTRIKELQANIRQLHIKRNKLIDRVKSLKKSSYRECLLLRYAENKEISEIAEIMCYEYKSIVKLHSKAVKAYAETACKAF